MRLRYACSSLLVLAACGETATSTTAPDGSTHTTTRDAGHVDAPTRTLDAGMPKGDAGHTVAMDAAHVDGRTADGATSVDASTPCGTRTGMRGMTSRSLTVAGLARTYIVYLPSTADPTAPMPFVYVFHGYTMSGAEMVDITQYQAIADADGVAVVFPDGEGGPDSLLAPWNVENPGQTVCGDGQLEVATGDDFAFMDAMKADVSKDQCVDESHVFATGFSMGGYFSHHIGCYKDGIRAVAPASGGTLADLSVCTTGHVPVIIFHGAADPIIDEGCDDPTGTMVPGFPASATLWAAKNGCQNSYTTLTTDGDAGGDGQCYLYDGCPADGQVEVCTFTGMVHCWAGGSSTGSGAAYACPSYASATSLEWQFFKTYAW